MNDIAQGSNFLHCILLVIGASLKWTNLYYCSRLYNKTGVSIVLQ